MLKEALLKLQGEKDNFKIEASQIHGNGVIATVKILNGEPINAAFLPDMKITKFGAHLNHSSQPNAITKKNGDYRITYALKDIDPGDEITVDYTVNKDLEQPKSFWK
jgi:hypothetical protein